MYKYNNYIKLVMVCGVIIWSVYHFQGHINEASVYDSEGNLKREGQVINNLNQGLWTWYDKNGIVILKGHFVDGKREGVWQTFDSTGNLVIESTYKNNLLNGVFKRYTNNVLVHEELYKDDRIISIAK